MQSQSDCSSSQRVEFHQGIGVEFIGKNLTKFGGMQLVKKFFRGLRVKEELESAAGIENRESKFSVAGMLVCLLYAVTLYLKRQGDTVVLKLDKIPR